MLRFRPLSVTICSLTALFLAILAPGESCLGTELIVLPPRVRLDSPEASLQLVVGEREAGGRVTDRTRAATYQLDAASEGPSGPPVSVDQQGRVLPLAEGTASIVVRYGERQVRVPVEVTELERPRPVSFRQEVIPALTKAGCNSGGCHGKAEGQNGFKLSVFGFDAETDHAALVKEARGRRIHLAAPEHSLLLRKATAAVPHGGGRQISEGSIPYRRILRWIREGAALEAGPSTAVVRIEVQPDERVLSPGGAQQLRVILVDEAGDRRDVTAEAEYESNDVTIAGVDEQGLVQAGDIPGEAAVLVRYMGHVTLCRIAVPRAGVTFERPPENNFIDKLVWDKLQRLGIPPSDLAGDAVFLRRVYLDTIGTLPTPGEAREFLDSRDPAKRERLIDALLERDAYASYWALRWSDILRIDSNALGSESAVAFSRWLRRQFAENRPYDEFVREIMTARGNTRSESPAPLYDVLNDPKELSRSVSQLFLGVRIECAECHHHPFERWSQADFYAFTGFFTGLKKKKTPDGGSLVYPVAASDLKHPRTGEVVPAAPLGGEPIDQPEANDRRAALVDWMTAEDNPFFAKVLANRLWAHYFGRGLVEPVDDLRATNPATNEPLLEALADHLRGVDYDLKAFTRTLLRSRVYQLSARTLPENETDRQNFSHAMDRPLPAEVLLDAICQVTEVPEKFNGWPQGPRAVDLWDNRMPSYFLRIFGRPTRTTVCSCERGDAPSISQALHLMNSPEITEKIAHRQGRARRLAESDLSLPEIVNELYLATLARYPTENERRALLQLAAGQGDDGREAGLAERHNGGTTDQGEPDPFGVRRAVTEDILWVLLNSKEFLYNH